MSSVFPPLAETEKMAAQMLAQPNPVATLSLAEAMVVVDMMRPKRIAAGTTFISEGEAEHIDYMMLILSGDAIVETRNQSGTGSRVVSVISAGASIGEMSLIDGLPRLTSCRALTDLSAAVLTRTRLQEALLTHPVIVAKFLLCLHARSSSYSRATLEKFGKVLQMNDVLREQLDTVMNSRTAPPSRQ